MMVNSDRCLKVSVANVTSDLIIIIVPKILSSWR